MSNQQSNFNPDYEQEHPGEFLKETLEARGIKVVDLARRCGRPTKTISEIISGTTAITPETAIQFERALGESADMWLGLQATYELQEARKMAQTSIAGTDAKEWLKLFPISDLVSNGYIHKKTKPSEKVEELLAFFGVGSISAWHSFWGEKLCLARFKQNQHKSTSNGAVAAWIRKGELEASQISTMSFDKRAFKAVLPELRSLTQLEWSKAEQKLVEMCANCGVAVVCLKDLKRTGLRGAALWANKDKAVILISDRFKSEEKTWFAFFHEAMHILHHSKKVTFWDLEGFEKSEVEIEKEANEFAADLLVSKHDLQRFLVNHGRNITDAHKYAVTKFANDIGVSPGLFLERLQREKVASYAVRMSKTLKRKLEFAN